MREMYPAAATRSAWHSLVWLVWLLAGVLAISTNPLFNALILVQAVLVALACHTESPVGHAFGLFVKLGALLVLMRTVLSGIPIGGFSYGGTLLLTLPEIQLPIWLGGLYVGGAVTLEMMLGGLIAGIRLWTLLLVFGAFNAVADHYALLRRTPRFLFHAGLVTTIALTFVPNVVLQLQAIRDAQRVRGHRFRSWRDALPLLVPLLAGGLERSIQLAEAMDSRGYGRTTQHGSTLGAQLLLIVGLTGLALGLYLGFTNMAYGWLLALGGLIVVGSTLRRLGGSQLRTRYLRERWHRRDTLATLASLAIIVGCAVLRLYPSGQRWAGLLYTTNPPLRLPPFEPWVGALLLLLSAPALIQLLSAEVSHDRSTRLRPAPLAD